jgi:hypothetical protein
MISPKALTLRCGVEGGRQVLDVEGKREVEREVIELMGTPARSPMAQV